MKSIHLRFKYFNNLGTSPGGNKSSDQLFHPNPMYLIKRNKYNFKKKKMKLWFLKPWIDLNYMLFVKLKLEGLVQNENSLAYIFLYYLELPEIWEQSFSLEGISIIDLLERKEL